MRKILTVSALFLFAMALAADNATIADILKDPAKVDGKTITVTGKVAKFKAKTSKIGNKYFTFSLMDGKSYILVYGQGELKPEPKDGDKVEATGKFDKERNLRDFIVKNQLDVSAKEPGSKNGVKVIK